MTARRELLRHLIDDASQFPPARTPLDRAATRHGELRRRDDSWILGRFLTPGSRTEELEPGDDWRIGVVSDGDPREDLVRALAVGADALELKDPGLLTDDLGAPVDVLAELAGAPISVFVEGSADLARLADLGLGAKLRCGGVTPDAFPDDATVAAFIGACRELSLPFKCTAGLHHPFRARDDELGVLQHGFVNLLAATVLPLEDLETVIAETDPGAFTIADDAFAWGGRSAGPDEIRAGRRLFTAFGSCSFDEPIDDLGAYGVLTA